MLLQLLQPLGPMQSSTNATGLLISSDKCFAHGAKDISGLRSPLDDQSEKQE